MADRSSSHPKPAAGLPAVLSALSYTVDRAGLARGLRALGVVNQDRGFDCPGCAWPDPAPRDRSFAEFCENGARAVAHEADRRRVDAAFFAEHGIGDLAGRSDRWLEQRGRLVQPMLRDGGEHFRPISYDEAFALVGEALRGLSSPNEAVFYTSGRASNEAAFLYQLFARTLGTNNLPDCSNLCHESSGTALRSTIGVGKGTVTLEDFALADLILVIGQNPGTNHPRMLSTLAEARARGATIVAINPLREPGLVRFAHPQTAEGLLGVGQPIASEHVPVRINGDVPLLKGVMKELFALEAARGGVLDHAFIAEHTHGFEAFRDALARIDGDVLVEQSGVPQSTLKRLAEIYASARRVIVCWAMGLTQHKNAVANVREIVNLLLLRGNIGRPGAGVCPVRGHSNVQGDRTMGIHAAPSEALLAALDRTFGIRAPRAPGLDSVGAVRAMERGEVSVFVALGGNFARAMSDTERTLRALGKVKLAVHVATKLNATHVAAGERAILLPCLARSELDARSGVPRFVSVEDSMGVVRRSEGTLPPADPGLLSEIEIVARLGAATFGTERPVPWLALAEDYDRIRALIEETIPGFARYNERVRAPGGFVLPNAARERRFETKSGKAEFTVQPLEPLRLAPQQLLLMTIRSHDQFNTTVYADDDRYRGIRGNRRVVFLNPEDMAERRLAAGALVDITSHYEGVERTVRAFACVPYDIPRRCAAAYFPEANGLVPLESVADESRTPTSKSIVVTLSPAAESNA
ncbi:MAG: FdhF/YdeP family oxidoreductase [Pseudomonadota bacterium]